MDPKLLEILACPSCHGDLAQKDQSLLCEGCGLNYRIDDGIPILLIEEATRSKEI